MDWVSEGLAIWSILECANRDTQAHRDLSEREWDILGRRVVLGGFNVQCAIMRKVVPYNINGKAIDTKATAYHDFRGGSIDRKRFAG